MMTESQIHSKLHLSVSEELRILLRLCQAVGDSMKPTFSVTEPLQEILPNLKKKKKNFKEQQREKKKPIEKSTMCI